MNDIQLRDYLAGLAMQAFLPDLSSDRNRDGLTTMDLAKAAYFVADAMLEARKQP